MKPEGGVSSPLPSIPDGHDPLQDCLGKLRGGGLHTIMTHTHPIKPGLVRP
jgi:hypothetical protein